MKGRIERVGYVVDLSEGRYLVKDWSFDCRPLVAGDRDDDDEDPGAWIGDEDVARLVDLGFVELDARGEIKKIAGYTLAELRAIDLEHHVERPAR